MRNLHFISVCILVLVATIGSAATPEQEKRVAELRAVATANPYAARPARRLGFALREAGQLEEAREWFEKALALDGDSPGDLYNLACMYGVLNEPEKALDYLEKALDHRFAEDDILLSDADLEAVRKLPRFQEITGFYPPANLSRDEQWRYDLDFFARRMERMHWNLYAHFPKPDFIREVESLKTDVPKLSDAQVRARLRRIIARVGDGHTLLSAWRDGDSTATRFPVDLYLFSDGIFVRGAAKEYRRIVGARVVKFGPISADAAYEAMKPYLSVDNEMGYRDYVPSLASTDLLEAIGASEPGKKLELTLSREDGSTFKQSIATRTIKRQSPRKTRIDGFVYADDAATAPVPLWKKDQDKTLWYEYRRDQNLVYCWMSAIDDTKDKTFEAFCNEMFEFIEKNKVDRLVLDMRLNGGGNTGVVLPLIHGIVRSRVNETGKLYTIIGRRTFSAAMNTVSLLELHSATTFVGEPTGSRPNFVGESTSFVLPCTRYRVYCSSRYWQHVSSTDTRPWIAPGMVAEMSSRDFAANRDPAMDAIFAEISKPASN